MMRARTRESRPVRAARVVLVAALAATLSLGSGCGTRGGSPPTAAAGGSGATIPVPVRAPVDPAISSTDPCAMQMHAICGGLLFYYAVRADLPATLEELRDFPGLPEPIDTTCPESKLPYLYDPAGIEMIERQAYIVLFDPMPSHAGQRWAIQVEQPEYGKPLVAKVVALPESFFLLRRAR